jgi:hypothetical protein
MGVYLGPFDSISGVGFGAIVVGTLFQNSAFLQWIDPPSFVWQITLFCGFDYASLPVRDLILKHSTLGYVFTLPYYTEEALEVFAPEMYPDPVMYQYFHNTYRLVWSNPSGWGVHATYEGRHYVRPMTADEMLLNLPIHLVERNLNHESYLFSQPMWLVG